MKKLIKKDAQRSLHQNGKGTIAFAIKDILKLACNVFVMEFKLEISVIDALINLIQFGMDIFVNVNKDLLKLMDSVNLILDQ